MVQKDIGMLRRFLDYQLSLAEKGKPFQSLHPLIAAGDTFLFEAPINTKASPHIRDAIDVKRWMFVVVLALIPCFFAALWNTGLQSFVYSSRDYHLMNEYLSASTTSWDAYWGFALKDNRYLTILKEGFSIVFPLLLISYIVGGLWEALFAVVRGHDISEGFLVSGFLYALILPPTIPYWMAAVGISVGIVLGKEVFGGSGMNILNPALVCRAFLFFAFPGRMSGDVWVGQNPTVIRQSLIKMNQDAQTSSFDGYTQATKLAQFNVSTDIKKIHIDAIASNNLGENIANYSAVKDHFDQWNALGNHKASFGALTQGQMKEFVTSPLTEGGLGLSSANFDDAYRFSALNYEIGHNNDWGFFFGDKLGSIGETSIFACLLGALFLIYTGIGSWRTMVSMALGAYFTALCFEYASKIFGIEGGIWNPAIYGFSAYKHLLLGSLVFGLVFMATDPVSSPSMNLGKWIYGAFAGIVTIIIRTINPAYPEGVMLAIMMANVFAPLIDYYSVRFYRRAAYART